MRMDCHRSSLIKYLFSKCDELPSSNVLLFAVADAVLQDVRSSIKSKVCPYCGRAYAELRQSIVETRSKRGKLHAYKPPDPKALGIRPG